MALRKTEWLILCGAKTVTEGPYRSQISGTFYAADMANMFQFMHDFSDEFIARRPVADTRALHPGLLNFDGWLARHARRLAVPPPLALAGA